MSAEAMQPECQLEQASSLSLGLYNFVWEPGIPTECHQCFHELGKVVSEQSFEIDEEDEDADGYFCFGMKAVSEYGRLAVEDTGIDYCGDNEGPLTSRTMYEFECPKPNRQNQNP